MGALGKPLPAGVAGARLLPWLAGAGLAAGNLLTASNCSVPRSGGCAGCGSCLVALGVLVGWAVVKQRRGEAFYR